MQTDQAYLDWIAFGGVPTQIDSETSLWDVLAFHYPAGISISNTIGQDQLKNYNITKLDIVAFKVLFNHENRIRALENKQPITAQQFINGIKALL